MLAPRVAEVEAPSGEALAAGGLEGPPRRLPVVDDLPYVARLVGRLRTADRQGEELVTHVDEGHRSPMRMRPRRVSSKTVP